VFTEHASLSGTITPWWKTIALNVLLTANHSLLHQPGWVTPMTRPAKFRNNALLRLGPGSLLRCCAITTGWVSYWWAYWNIGNIPVISLRNYGGGSIILPPDNAVWLYALPYIYLSCVDSVAELNRTTQKISTTTVVVRFITAFASLIQR